MTFSSSIRTAKSVFFLLAITLCGHGAWAQSTSISPYSRFGLGEIHDGTQTEQFSMAGLSIPVLDPFAFNAANPATYHHIAKPIFAVGMRYQIMSAHTENQSQMNQNHVINNLAVAFPLANKRWGLAAGVMPFSSMGYSIVDQSPIPESNESARLEYTGVGGLSRAYLGNSYRLFEKQDTLGNKSSLSVGANVSYIFGNLDETRKLIFPFGGFGYNFRAQERIRVDDLGFDFGLMYAFHLRKMTEKDRSFIRMNIGLTYRLPVNLNTRGSSLAETFTVGATTGAETAKDTVYYNDYGSGSTYVPASYGVGVGLDMVTRKSRKWFFGVEYRTEMWSESSRNIGDVVFSDEMGNSQRFVFGMDLMPNYRASRKVLEKTHYRMGVRYEQMSLILQDQQLEAYGISFGVGVPISLRRPQSPSTFNIGVEVGRRGTTADNLLREDYVMISFGLTLMPHFRNNWFVQRKYD